MRAGRGLVIRCLRGDILGYVDEHGAFSAVLGDFKCLADRRRKLFYALDKPACLCNGLCDLYDVDLLKAVSAELVGVDVCGDRDHRYRVYVRGGKTCYDICCAGARGGKHHAGFTR